MECGGQPYSGTTDNRFPSKPEAALNIDHQQIVHRMWNNIRPTAATRRQGGQASIRRSSASRPSLLPEIDLGNQANSRTVHFIVEQLRQEQLGEHASKRHVHCPKKNKKLNVVPVILLRKFF